MRRDEQHRRVVVEAPLRAVAVMHVVVDDRDAREPRARACAAATAMLLKRQNPIAFALGMVAGRTHQREARAPLPVQHVLDRGDRRAAAGWRRRRYPAT